MNRIPEDIAASRESGIPSRGAFSLVPNIDINPRSLQHYGAQSSGKEGRKDVPCHRRPQAAQQRGYRTLKPIQAASHGGRYLRLALSLLRDRSSIIGSGMMCAMTKSTCYRSSISQPRSVVLHKGRWRRHAMEVGAQRCADMACLGHVDNHNGEPAVAVFWSQAMLLCIIATRSYQALPSPIE